MQVPHTDADNAAFVYNGTLMLHHSMIFGGRVCTAVVVPAEHCRVMPELCRVMPAESVPNRVAPMDLPNNVRRCPIGVGASELCRVAPEPYQVTPDLGPNRVALIGHGIYVHRTKEQSRLSYSSKRQAALRLHYSVSNTHHALH